MAITEDAVREELKSVIDPELFVNIVDLGLIYKVDVTPSDEEEGKFDVTVDMTMTSPACPAGPQLLGGSTQAVERMEEVAKCEVKLVMTPPWTPDRMTDDARDHLGIF
jgi:metal-sulfur cluster biosynthetic enzyme